MSDSNLVISAQIIRNFGGTEMVVLADVENLADDFSRSRMRTLLGPARPVTQPCLPVLVKAAFPLIEGLA